MRRLVWITFSALVIAACSSRYDPSGEPSMSSHFGAAADVQSAVIQGDLRAVRAPAAWLGEHDTPNLPVGSEMYLTQLQRAAQQAQDATTLDEAAQALGEIGRACGACHAEFLTGPEAIRPAAATAGEELGAHMARHAWATDRLWDGLVLPSDGEWVRGARALAESPFEASTAAGDKATDAGYVKEIELLENRGHAIGSKAAGVSDAAERAGLYGELLTTCAYCHRLTGQKVATGS